MLRKAGKGRPEDCDGVDDDCDGVVDDADWYVDGDADGFGAGAPAVSGCPAPDGYVALGTDCDDAAPRVYPGAPEICDGVADDCDSVDGWTSADEDGLVTYADDAGSVSDVSAAF